MGIDTNESIYPILYETNNKIHYKFEPEHSIYLSVLSIFSEGGVEDKSSSDVGLGHSLSLKLSTRDNLSSPVETK